MEFFTGALPSLLPKLAALATGEYNLQKGLKGEIRLLHAELECVQGALEDISKVPVDQLPNGDKIWARNMRELSYDMEDSIDKFMVRCNKSADDELAKQDKHGSKNAIGRCLDLLMQPMIRRKIATEIRSVKSRVVENNRSIIVIDDIWNISHWEMIKRALPDNHGGYGIITTTRIFDIAKQVGGIYRMKPLSPSNSRILLCSRILDKTDQENYLDKDLAEVSDKILKKCAGVPLAIITIASLLANKGRDIMDWYNLYNSIGTGLENSQDVDNMRKILLLSYYDLPSHLKTCLLYLSIFPEDSKIEKDRLIWMWAAEGFIQCKRQGESLLELGQSYFNELVNRSMIQLVNPEFFGDSEYCHVHDMVLDLIFFLSSEENFVTLLSDTKDHTSPSKTVRRLSLQDCKARIQDNISKKRIRSVVVFSFGNDPKLDLGSFRVLRVLDLEQCRLSNAHSLKYLGKLIHLRYLGLRDTDIEQLPEELGSLRFLQSLDIRGTLIYKFPLTVFQLKHLRCLQIDACEGVPKGISSLTSLEVLTLMAIRNSTTITELGHLTELRVLKIELDTDDFCTDGLQKSLAESLVDCLQKLKKIQSVDILDFFDEGGPLDAWRAPPSLRKIDMRGPIWFSARPNWMNPSHLQHLSLLTVQIKELQQEDLEILGRLPALHHLFLALGRYKELKVHPGLVVGASSFPSLVRCKLLSFVPPVVFRQGAMPRLTDLTLTFPVGEMREIAGSMSGFELGLENLTSLRNIKVVFHYDSDSKQDKEEAMAVLRNEAEIHPNRPTITEIPWVL
ncbi:hypothetical protein HU200_048967 [Digitaria exilis]|uniref:Uncharacterized protein n=1 Tax=Digitaria exilis TaxID=1010633 RepID=A0A835ECQ0_9POAL|nr:hypothetical protein HU200_048967 [Digitaria exilis]